MAVPKKRAAADSKAAASSAKSNSQPPPAKKPKATRKKPVPGRKPGRPPKVAPLGLLDLPVEIVGRIASFLLPLPVTTEDGFLPPGSMPYGGERSKSACAKVKQYAYGGIPRGVRDVLALARTCRHCDSGVALVLGRMGNGTAKGRKRTMYISLPTDDGAEGQLPDEWVMDRSATRQIFANVAESSDTLENLVFHQCSHINDEGYNDDPLEESILMYMTPFQASSITFSNLQSLQLGPRVCKYCICMLLHLFVGKRYLRHLKGHQLYDPDSPEEILPSSTKYPHVYILGLAGRNDSSPFARANECEVLTYDHSAAPNLSHLQVFSPDTGYRMTHDRTGVPDLLQVIPDDNTITMLQIWLFGNDRWGGFGSCGTSTASTLRSPKVIEQELTEWAKQEKDKGMSMQERMLAKFEAQAAKAMPKPKPRKSIMSSARHRATDASNGKSKETPSGINAAEEPIDTESSEPKDPVPEPSTLNDAEVKREYSDSGDEDEATDHQRVFDSADRDDTASNDTSGKKPTKTRAERVAGYALAHQTSEYLPILEAIAAKFPNLVGLSIARRGTYRVDVVEGFRNPDQLLNVYVEPLAKLDKLVHLDLGMAVCGKNEVSEFPLGLSLHPTRKAMELAKTFDTDIQALKRRKYEQGAKKAIDEGDKWRMQVLEQFAIQHETPEVVEGESTNGNVDDLPAKWPKGVKSGYVIAPDLGDRRRGRGLAIPWKVNGRKIELGKPKQIAL